MQNLLSNNKTGPGKTVKQEQEKYLITTLKPYCRALHLFSDLIPSNIKLVKNE